MIILSEHGEPYQSALDCTLAELSAMGYVKDKDVTFTTYSLDNYKGRAVNILRRESQTPFDLIVVYGTVGMMALKAIIFDDPRYPKIVFSCITDPVGAGVVADFSSPPAHNFTGVAYPVPVHERLAFIRKVMPEARTIGLIFADMPQSHSYNQWLLDALNSDSRFAGYRILFRSVPFVESKGGKIRMAERSIRYIKALDPHVDLFLSANDQLASQPFFPRNVQDHATKPLVGINREDVMGRRGATMAIFPTAEGLGRQTAAMIQKLLAGALVRDVIPEKPVEFGVAFDMDKVRQFHLHIPETLLKQAGDNIITN